MKSLALLTTLLAVLATGIRTPAGASEPITVHTADGRKHVAWIDARTDGSSLWLRFESTSVTLLRAVAWSDISGAIVGEQTLNAEELRERAASLATVEQRAAPIPPPPVESLPPTSATRGPTMADQARWALAAQPRVQGFSADALLANWDADVEDDGLVVFIAPFVRPSGPVIPVAGTVEVKLWAPVRQSFHEVPQGRGQSLQLIGQWTRQITPELFFDDGVELLLPFERVVAPDRNDRVGNFGLVHVRLVVPGHGVLERRVEVVRIRSFSPFRDRYGIGHPSAPVLP